MSKCPECHGPLTEMAACDHPGGCGGIFESRLRAELDACRAALERHETELRALLDMLAKLGAASQNAAGAWGQIWTWDVEREGVPLPSNYSSRRYPCFARIDYRAEPHWDAVPELLELDSIWRK